ncbi:MAG: PIN domain-containing protein [Planctomycetia bacterium]|nr:PIN domain-containing protein [Candidatus Brocadia sp.]QOJ06248.1 MAG: PIN domain-containing protein [Planctomycetia bacterium]TVL94796.1 MAG: hypothetical protein CV082_13475 [Candidatus Brocadia sp. BL1]HQU32179.1 PIN domain-containing protein [Candidatus Brocadia sapporoensis]
MKLNDLKAGENVFIDANIFIYNFGAQSAECRELLLRCAKKELTGYTSTLIISEVLHRLMVAEALQKGFINEKNPVKQLKEKQEIIKKLSTYNHDMEKILEMNIKIIELTKELIRKSVKTREKEGLLTNDSILLATMKELGLLNLATNDDDFDRIKSIHIYKPSDM